MYVGEASNKQCKQSITFLVFVSVVCITCPARSGEMNCLSGVWGNVRRLGGKTNTILYGEGCQPLPQKTPEHPRHRIQSNMLLA